MFNVSMCVHLNLSRITQFFHKTRKILSCGGVVSNADEGFTFRTISPQIFLGRNQGSSSTRFFIPSMDTKSKYQPPPARIALHDVCFVHRLRFCLSGMPNYVHGILHVCIHGQKNISRDLKNPAKRLCTLHVILILVYGSALLLIETFTCQLVHGQYWYLLQIAFLFDFCL